MSSMEIPAARGGRILWGVGAVLSLGVALFSLRYLMGLGLVPRMIAANANFHPWLPLHVAGAAAALMVAPFQLLPGLGARRRGLHRLMGRIYAAGCLSGAATGLVLAFGASTGPVSTAGFGSLAVLWGVSTVQGWRHAVRRDFAAHRAWMIRSFALTLAAVTLRLYLAVVPLLPVGFEDAYRAISFLCWVPNLILAEAWLRRGSAPAPLRKPLLARQG